MSIEPLEKLQPEPILEAITEEKIVLENHKIYTFKNVLFDFYKADLLPISLDELQKLYSHLETNQNITIEIYGHTDAIGTQIRNEQLSQERANAVADYLMSLGLDSERIK